VTSKVRTWGVAAACACLHVLIALSLAPSLLSRIVLFPIPLVVGLVPASNLGTATEPMYEATPVHVLAVIVSLPLCAVMYTVLFYALFTLGRRSE
jgi:hypothetical protein